MKLYVLSDSVGPSGRTPHELDPGIAGLLQILNDSGYTTRWSCSGLMSDHPGGKNNMVGRGDDHADLDPTNITFYTQSVTPELRKVLRRLGFSIRQSRRGREGMPGQTTAMLSSRLPDREILLIFDKLGGWAKQNPTNLNR